MVSALNRAEGDPDSVESGISPRVIGPPINKMMMEQLQGDHPHHGHVVPLAGVLPFLVPEFVQQLPKSSTGKIQRFKLR